MTSVNMAFFNFTYENISLDDYLINDRESSFMIKVKTDSMIDAGIRSGDMLIVERSKEPKIGDVVIVRQGGEFKIKYFNMV